MSNFLAAETSLLSPAAVNTLLMAAEAIVYFAVLVPSCRGAPGAFGLAAGSNASLRRIPVIGGGSTGGGDGAGAAAATGGGTAAGGGSCAA